MWSVRAAYLPMVPSRFTGMRSVLQRGLIKRIFYKHRFNRRISSDGVVYQQRNASVRWGNSFGELELRVNAIGAMVRRSFGT